MDSLTPEIKQPENVPNPTPTSLPGNLKKRKLESAPSVVPLTQPSSAFDAVDLKQYNSAEELKALGTISSPFSLKIIINALFLY